MLIRMAQLAVALIITIGLAACEGLPVQPLPAATLEGSLTTLGQPESVMAQVTSTTTETLTEEMSAPMAPVADLSTPALIDQALAQGEITAEERLLYLAYAVYEYESLPMQFHSNVGWRGTDTVRELYQTVSTPEIMCGLTSTVQNELRRVLNDGVTCND